MITATARLVLPADPRSPGRAREFVASTLDAWGVVSEANEAKLLTSELVTNAVLHARTELMLTVTMDDELGLVRISVHDGSKAVPRRRRYSPLATTGRGLNMVDAASHASGVDQSADGKAVWFEIALTTAAAESLTDLV